ncbi:MAG: hypothetical protein E6I75_28420, partial [Chloroflexi bacterium]
MRQLVKTSSSGDFAHREQAALRLYVQELLTQALGRNIVVTALRSDPIQVPSLFPADVLSVSLDDGTELSLFVKHLGSQQADHPDKQYRCREVRIYEVLLRDVGLPVAGYYGSRWNVATQRRDVYLEYVPDWSLKYTDLEHWPTAARRLAQLQAYFAARPVACDFLLRLDAAYFHAWAERAMSAVVSHRPELEGSLAGIVAGYSRVAELLDRQPITLVHNDLAPKYVVADRARTPARICLVDWEMAGVGCGLLDLVHLKYGLGPRPDSQMRAAYCAELAGSGLLPTRPRELKRLFAACEVHQTMCRLAYF